MPGGTGSLRVKVSNFAKLNLCYCPAAHEATDSVM